MATRSKEVSSVWGLGERRVGISAFAMPKDRVADTFSLSVVLVLAASLLLSACADAVTGRKDDAVFFGGAGGGNGGGGATSGVSVSW
jgi:hypothetical protein